jgi:single-stranded-DNA-specific exonuclease
MMDTRTAVLGVEQSLSGKAWRWRGGNASFPGGVAGLEDDLVTQLLIARGVSRPDLALHLAPSLRGFLPDPALFNDMATAAERIAEAVVARETVTVFGDYDVDGATSAALLIRLLRMLGHDAAAYIPDRLLEGYGPSGQALVALGQGGSTLVITVDCGAMAHDALAMAHDAGIDVIVVDHHKCAPDLPRAFALVQCDHAGHGNLPRPAEQQLQISADPRAQGFHHHAHRREQRCRERHHGRWHPDHVHRHGGLQHQQHLGASGR